jgi:HemY protein
MQGNRERRDGWLKMAYEQDDGARNVVLLTQAELQLAEGEHEQARASLNRIRDEVPNHPHALRLLAELHIADRDWPVVIELLPALRKTKNVPAEQIDAWAIQANEALLSAPDISRSRIDELWQPLSRVLRKSPGLLHARARALIATGQTELAETEIRKALKSEWDDELVMIYAELKPANKDAHLKQTETWLAVRPEDPLVLLAAGRACISCELWGKARSYLETSLAIRATPTAYQQLGQLMLRLDEKEAATIAFAKGLTLSNDGLPDLPRLESGR